MKSAVIILFVTLSFAGCVATSSNLATNSEEQARLDKIRKHPLVFTLPKEQSDEAWSRAQSFVATSSSMKVQIASDFIIETYNPTKPGQFGYRITRTLQKDDVLFSVDCIYYSSGVDILLGSDEGAALDNAHICAWYIATGELFPYHWR